MMNVKLLQTESLIEEEEDKEDDPHEDNTENKIDSSLSKYF